MSRELTPGLDNIEDHMSSQNNVTEKKTTIFELLQRWKDIFWIIVISCRSNYMNIATFLLLYWKTLTPWCVLHCKCCLKPETEEHFHQVQNVQRLCACFCSWNQIQNLLNQVISNFTNCNLFDCSNWSTATDTFSEILDDLEKTKFQGCHQTLI